MGRSVSQTRRRRGAVRFYRLGFEYFLRAIGLELINVAARVRLHRSLEEPKKPVIKSSSWLALSRCAVHILPTTFSIVLLVLNLRHYWIGADLQGLIISDSTNLALLQVAAKIQELLITASVGTVLFHIIRSELMYGNGVPLGLLGSGFAFTELSYFWSPDFWCSLPYEASVRRKLALFGSILIAGFLAVAAGPSSAVLVIPRSQPWPAGGSSFYLNGTGDEIWPKHLTFDPSVDQPYCISNDATSYGVCPSGGFTALWSHYHQVNVTSFLNNGTNPPYAVPLSATSYYYGITSPRLQVPSQIALGTIRKEATAHPTFLTQPHAASIIFQQKLAADWWEAVRNVSWTSTSNIGRYHYFSNLDAGSLSQVPSVIIQCSQAQNISADSSKIEFPVQPFMTFSSKITTVQDINTTASDHVRFSWYEMNATEWPGISMGAYIEMPWSAQGDSRIVVACSVQALWLKSEVHQDPFSAYAFYAKNPTGLGDASNTAITVDRAWLDALTPQTPQQGPGYYGWGPTTIESIIMGSGIDNMSTANSTYMEGTQTGLWNSEVFTGGGNRSTFLESIVASHVVDGVSRYGSHKAYNTTGVADDWSLWDYQRVQDFNRTLLRGSGGALERPNGENITELRADMTIIGYSFRASGITDYLSMAVIALHMLIAIGHTCWVVYHKQSSSCWDSIPELLAIAQNSRPAYKALTNTGAGIKKGSTFAQKARVRITKIDDHDDTDHVELLFDKEEVGKGHETLPLNVHRRISSAAPAALQVSLPTPTMLSLDELPPAHRATADPHSAPSSRSPSPLPIQHIASMLLPPQVSRHSRHGSSGSDTPLVGNYMQTSGVELVEVDTLYG